jgi:predicted Zn-dependent protease
LCIAVPFASQKRITGWPCAHLKQGSWAAAYQELQRTIELQPENWSAQLDLAQLVLTAGKARDAKDRALLILRNNPRRADAQVLLVNSDAVLGNLKDALEEAKEVTEMAPNRGVVFTTLASIQVRAGAMANAKANLRKAQSRIPLRLRP